MLHFRRRGFPAALAAAAAAVAAAAAATTTVRTCRVPRYACTVQRPVQRAKYDARVRA